MQHYFPNFVVHMYVPTSDITLCNQMYYKVQSIRKYINVYLVYYVPTYYIGNNKVQPNTVKDWSTHISGLSQFCPHSTYKLGTFFHLSFK